VGRIRYYFVPDSNARLYGTVRFGAATELLSEIPAGGDQGETGEIPGGRRRYDRGTNYRPDLVGTHPLGSAADFAGQTDLPEVQPPEPDCAQLDAPQWTLLVYDALTTSAGESFAVTLPMHVEYILGPYLPAVAGDVWGCPAALAYHRYYVLGGSAGDLWGVKGKTHYFVAPHYSIAGEAGDLWGCHGKTHYFVAPDYSIIGTAGDVWAVRGKGVYHVPHELVGVAGDVWAAPSVLTYVPKAFELVGVAGDVWAAPSVLTYVPKAFELVGVAGDVWAAPSVRVYVPKAFQLIGVAGDVWAAPSVLAYSGVYLQDTFTDADGTALGSHTCDTGQKWVDQSAGIQVWSDQARVNSLGGTHLSHVDPGHSDYTLTLDYTRNFATNVFYLVFRYGSSLTTSWSLQYNGAVFTLRAGATTEGSYVTTLTLGTTHSLKVVASGDNVQVWLDGVQRINVTVSSGLNTQQPVGLQMSSTSVGHNDTVDNLLVTP